MSYMYYCSACNKVFKANAQGKKLTCPKCEGILSDLSISDKDYSLLPASEKNILKQNMAIKADTLKLEEKVNVLKNEDRLPKISEAVLKTAVNTSDSLNDTVTNNKDMLAAVKNNYLKMQIQNQILATDNFVSICTMSALKDDGKIDPNEARLLKKLEKLSDDYKKGLNKLI